MWHPYRTDVYGHAIGQFTCHKINNIQKTIHHLHWKS